MINQTYQARPEIAVVSEQDGQEEEEEMYVGAIPEQIEGSNI
jgi:hypothetical protein